MPRKAKVVKSNNKKTTTPRVKRKRYLNPRVAFVISCLYFVAFILSPIKYDIFMTSTMSFISNALFIVSLVVSAMTLLEINFNRYKNKKLAIISLLIPILTFIYLVVNVLIKDNYYLLYIFICSIICIIYNLIFFKFKNKKILSKFPFLTYCLYIIILLTIYIIIIMNYKFFYNTEMVNMSNYYSHICDSLRLENFGFMVLYSIMYMGIISIVIFNIFNRINKKSLK